MLTNLPILEQHPRRHLYTVLHPWIRDTVDRISLPLYTAHILGQGPWQNRNNLVISTTKQEGRGSTTSICPHTQAGTCIKERI